MQLSLVVLGLVAGASAIDIGFHRAWDCSGAAAVVRNPPTHPRPPPRKKKNETFSNFPKTSAA